jgi:hypothetical protein
VSQSQSTKDPWETASEAEAGIARSPLRPAVRAALQGSWRVERISGLLPPLLPIRKDIGAAAGVTRIGPLQVPFDVEGRTLRYRGPLQAFVDELEPSGDGFVGRATVLGREYSRFRLIPAD